MAEYCHNCYVTLDEFAYCCSANDRWYCSWECAYSDLDVVLLEQKVNEDKCHVCNEKLESEIYETYKSDNEHFCTTECVDHYWGISFKSIPSE